MLRFPLVLEHHPKPPRRRLNPIVRDLIGGAIAVVFVLCLLVLIGAFD